MNHFVLRIMEPYCFGFSEIEISSAFTIKTLTDLKLNFISIKTTEILLPARPFFKTLWMVRSQIL